jgi:hypothetical protein
MATRASYLDGGWAIIAGLDLIAGANTHLFFAKQPCCDSASGIASAIRANNRCPPWMEADLKMTLCWAVGNLSPSHIAKKPQ